MKITAKNHNQYISLRKMCKVIVKYNGLSGENQSQYLVSHDIFIKMKRLLEKMSQ